MSQELSSVMNIRRCWEPSNRQKRLGDRVRAHPWHVGKSIVWGGSLRHGFKFQLCYCLLLRPTLLPPPIALKMRSWMQVVNLGDNPKTHQLGRSSKGRQRYKVSYPAVSITGSELQSCSWPEAREPRDMSTNTIPSSAEGINSLALQLVLCALWGWGWGVALR